MVSQVTALGRNGLHDWLIQRVSAIYMAIYFAFVAGFFIVNPGLDYATWSELFACSWFKWGTLLAMVSLMLHAWVGLWIVLMDYVKNLWVRITLQVGIITLAFVYIVWSIQILWA